MFIKMRSVQFVRHGLTNWKFDHFVDVNEMIGSCFTTDFASLLFQFLQLNKFTKVRPG
jgi:hypothetical protein